MKPSIRATPAKSSSRGIEVDGDGMPSPQASLSSGNYKPVCELIGAKTLEILAAPERIESYIIQDTREQRDVGFLGCTVLSEGPLLSDDQVTRLTESILTPEAHYNGCPIFRRFPSVPNFAFRVWRGECVLDVLVDLHNPGWEFHCGSERYRNWNRVADKMISLAKELFPQYASFRSQSVWKKGAIAALRKSAGADNEE